MTTTPTAHSAPPAAERQAWMAVLAKCAAGHLADLAAPLSAAHPHSWLRPPEVGGVMVRGRAGGTGAAFNLGEMTVTRCSLQLGCGTIGHAYVQGRDKTHATHAALIDALMQTGHAATVRATVLEPLEAAAQAARAQRAARAATTKVDFFTMVRGED